MLDAILSFVALAGFALFVGVLGWWVKEPALIVVLGLGLAGAAYDFWRAFRVNSDNGD